MKSQEPNKRLFVYLNAVSIIQFVLLTFAGYIISRITHDFSLLKGLAISSLTFFIFLQLIKLSSYNKLFAIFGFPIRIFVSGTLCAILVHKLEPNLIALFCGFAISLLLYLISVFIYIKE